MPTLAVVPVLAAATKAEDIFKQDFTCQSVSMLRGCVACLKTNGTDMDVVDPDNANAGPILGLVLSGGPITNGVYGAPALLDPILVQRFGRAVGLLATNQTIVRGDPLGVVAGTGGQLGFYFPGQNMRFVGFAGQSKTTTGTALFLEVDLGANPHSRAVMAVSGFASTAPGAATKFLSAPGTGAGSATAVPLFVVPPGGGIIRNLVASATTAPGGADTGIFTVQRNPLAAGAYGGYADTTLTCTISAAGVEQKDAVHGVTVNEGDLLAIKCVSSNVTLAGLSATFEFIQAP